MAKPKKGSWIVTMDCKVRKSVVVEDCTEAEALESPWDHAVEENEVDQMDWDVVKVERNE